MSAPLELLGARTGNCTRAAIAAEESGLPYVVRRIDLQSAEHRKRDFLALNPAGKVPVLIDRRSGIDLVVTQSNAIILHLAEAAPDRLLPTSVPSDHARLIERFLYFVTDVLSPSFAAFLMRSTGEATASERLTRIALGNLEDSQRFLEDGAWMGGDRFSIVDIAAVSIAAAMHERIDWTSMARLRDWFERASARPGVMRGMRAFD